MTYELDLSTTTNDAPIIKIKISDTEISFRVFFSTDCWKVMWDRHQQGDDFRTAFAKSVFQMYQQTPEKNIDIWKEGDFVDASDEALSSVLTEILKQDNQIRSIYDNIPAKDIYKRFYKANETIIRNMWGTFDLFERTLKNPLVPTAFKTTAFPTLTPTILNLPPPTINLSNIVSPFNRMMENIVQLNLEMTQKLRTPCLLVEQSIRSFKDSLHSFLLDYRLRSAQNREILLKYGWFLSDEFPIHIVNHIYNNRASLNAGAVDAIICSYFRKNRCEALKNMVSSWKESPHFACRKIIFHEALVHHSRGYYNSSVTLLTLHMEGIFSDFVRTNLNCSRYRVKQAIKDIQAELEKNPDVSISEEDAFNFIVRILTEEFHSNNPDDASDQSRNKIAHGHVYEKASESNSLKLFLSLNEMFHVLPLLSSSNCTSETES